MGTQSVIFCLKALAKVLHARDKLHYRDDNHKPEMAIAITDFEAMCVRACVRFWVFVLACHPAVETSRK